MFWIFLAFIVIVYLWVRAQKQKGVSTQQVNEQFSESISVEDCEERSRYWKTRIFDLEHTDSPHFIDMQDAYDAMERNYMRIKQRLIHEPERVLEVAKDWNSYCEALRDIKSARVRLDFSSSDDDPDEWFKQPYIIKDEIEKKFKGLLGEDFTDIPPDYFKRMEGDDQPTEEQIKKLDEEFGGFEDWRFYYRRSSNYNKWLERRKKANEEREKEKAG